MNNFKEWLLKEAMITPSSLPNGVIVIARKGNDNVSFNVINTLVVRKPSHHDLKAEFFLDGEQKNLGGLRLNSHRVSRGMYWTPHCSASQGYGPFLYDLAIEYATANGDGVVPALGTSSLGYDGGWNTEDSQTVWRHYYEKRHDVSHEDLPSNQKEDVPQFLRAIYKKEPVFLKQLEQSGRVEWL
jgi:hypothetical protein